MKLIDYIKGNRRGKEANRLEREAMSDPFLQDAMDGFDAVQGNHAEEIHRLEEAIRKRTQKHTINNALLLVSSAAVLLLLIGIGLLWKMQFQELPYTAHIKPEQVALPPKDTVWKNRPEKPEIQKVVARSLRKTPALKVAETFDTVAEFVPAAVKTDTEKMNPEQPVIAENKLKISDIADIKSADNLKSVGVEQSLQGRIAGVSIRATSPVKPKIVAGKVVDEKGEPVIGATVKVRGKNSGAVTDLKGNFTLSAIPGTDELEASYIGYEKKEIKALNDSNLIAMNPSQRTLDEVVVVGYGTVKKRDMTGSVASISSKANFGENEFKSYVQTHRKKEICNGLKGFIKVRFQISAQGKPVDLKVLECNCQDLQNEFETLLEKSPRWTKPNRTVRMIIRLK